MLAVAWIERQPLLVPSMALVLAWRCRCVNDMKWAGLRERRRKSHSRRRKGDRRHNPWYAARWNGVGGRHSEMRSHVSRHNFRDAVLDWKDDANAKCRIHTLISGSSALASTTASHTDPAVFRSQYAYHLQKG
ncbi:MAG: hypothetical protein J3Q66DRAFT_340421 [Benniella sp.]|nr:MAG: hypothetical protein J3Q66DRAFT_340421 [Benniella sp.]